MKVIVKKEWTNPQMEELKITVGTKKAQSEQSKDNSDVEISGDI
jgi:hypothetical protein